MDLDTLSRKLAASGFHTGLRWRNTDWECTLWNAAMVPSYQPMGYGATAIEAVENAIADRDRAVADGRARMK